MSSIVQYTKCIECGEPSKVDDVVFGLCLRCQQAELPSFKFLETYGGVQCALCWAVLAWEKSPDGEALMSCPTEDCPQHKLQAAWPVSELPGRPR